MSYSTDNAFSMPFVFPFPGTFGANNCGDSNNMFGTLMALLLFSLFGFGGFGGMGMRPGMPFPFGGGMCGGSAGANVAADTAAFVNAQNTADRVSSIATGVDAVAGIATANGVKIETVKDQNNAGFANLNTHLCEGFHSISQQFNAQTMQNMNMHNAATALLNDMRAEQAKCCCESKTLAQAIASQQQYQAATDKSEILRAIADSEVRITARMEAAEKAALVEKINSLNEQKSALKTQLDTQEQTAKLAALIQAQCGQPRACVPAPCGNPCFDGIQRAVNDAFGARISELLFPSSSTTPTTT